MNFNRLLVRAVVLSATLLMLGGCNTVRGVGRDVERAGEVIQGRSAQLAPIQDASQLPVQVAR